MKQPVGTRAAYESRLDRGDARPSPVRLPGDQSRLCPNSPTPARSIRRVGVRAVLQTGHEGGHLQARLLLGEQRLRRPPSTEVAQPALAVLAGVVRQGARATRTHTPPAQVEVPAVLLEGCYELLDSLLRGQR